MKTEELTGILRECFKNAEEDEKKGKKHKGLLKIMPDEKKALEYITKAKTNLELCNLYKEKGFDYKIPEEWFYTLYYCALAILAKFGIESRSQKYTALFLRYVKDKVVIDLDDGFINRITVYKEKERSSDVDEREKARYSSSLKSEEVSSQYNSMTYICKKAIAECEEIIFSNKQFKIPEELLKNSQTR